MMRPPILLNFFLLFFVLLVASSSSPAAALNERDELPISNSTMLNETWLSWTADWTAVGTSGLAAFSCLHHGPTAVLLVQRIRGFRPLIGSSCTWTDHFAALTDADDTKSILDRADTPTGFSIGDAREKHIVGMLWANLVLVVIILLLQVVVSIFLERYVQRKAREAGGAPPPPDGRSLPAKLCFYAARWGFGRCLTGCVCLPIFSVFRIACITLGARAHVSSATAAQAWAAASVCGIILGVYSFGLPLLALLRCHVTPKEEYLEYLEEIEEEVLKEGEKNVAAAAVHQKPEPAFLRALVEQTVVWEFEEEMDSVAYIALPSLEHIKNLKLWWFPFAEMCFTVCIDLAPLAVGTWTASEGSDRACFAASLAGIGITVTFLLVSLVFPFQKRITSYFFFACLLMELAAFLGGVLRDQQGAPMSQDVRAQALAATVYMALYCVVVCSWLFYILPFIVWLGWCGTSKKDDDDGSNNNGEKKQRSWEEELLGMLAVQQRSKGQRQQVARSADTGVGFLFLAGAAGGKTGGALSKTSLALPLMEERGFSSSAGAAPVAAAPAPVVSMSRSSRPSATAAAGVGDGPDYYDALLGDDGPDQTQQELDDMFKNSI